MNEPLPLGLQRYWNQLLLREGSLPQKWLVSPANSSGFSRNRVWKLTCCDTSFIHSVKSGALDQTSQLLHLPGLDDFVTDEQDVPALALRQWNVGPSELESIQAKLAFQEFARQFFEDYESLQKSLLSITHLDSNFDGNDLATAIQQSSLIPGVIQWSIGVNVIEVNRSYWTLERWIGGDSLEEKPLNLFHADDAEAIRPILMKLVSIIAKLHACGYQWSELVDANQRRNANVEQMIAGPTVSSVTKTCPGLRYRAIMWDKWFGKGQHQAWKQWEDWIGNQSTIDALSKQIVNISGFPNGLNTFEVLQRLSHSIRFCSSNCTLALSSSLDKLHAASHACYWVTRDLWRENVLLHENQVVGVVDFGASREDSPVLELVRMVSSYLPPKHPMVAELLDQYQLEYESEMRRMGVTLFKPNEINEADFHFYDSLATFISLFQWMDWLMDDEVPFDSDFVRVLERMNHLASRAATMLN